MAKKATRKEIATALIDVFARLEKTEKLLAEARDELKSAYYGDASDMRAAKEHGIVSLVNRIDKLLDAP